MQRVIRLSIALAIAVATTQAQDTMLAQSMAMTDDCLAELQATRVSFSQAKTYSNENIAAVLDANRIMKKEVADLQIENRNLKDQLNQTRLTVTSLKNQLHTITTTKGDINRTAVFPPSMATVHPKKSVSRYFQKRSNRLLRKHKGKSASDLLTENIYTIPVKSIHVRSDHSIKTQSIGYVTRGELVEFNDIFIKENNKLIVWLKTEKGWFYVPTLKDRKTLAALTTKGRDAEHYAALPSQEGGAKGF